MIIKETRTGAHAGPDPDGESYTFPGNTAPPLPSETMPPIPEALLAQDRRERIPDPTIRSVLPANILAALGNAHVNLVLQLTALLDLIDTLGWPEDESRNRYEPLDGRELSSALDYARANAELTWVLCGLVDVLGQICGRFDRGEDGTVLRVG